MTIPDDIMKTSESLWGASTLDIARALVAERGAWQPIGTAPDDGAEIIVFGGRYNKPTVALADGGYWRHHKGQLSAIPTHWMPLPAPPEASA